MFKKEKHTKEEYERQLQIVKKDLEIWGMEREILSIKRNIKEEKRQLRKKKLPSTTKLIVAFILINCTVVEVYSMWVMFILSDLSALYTLITAVIGESITFAIYAAKSAKENSVGGIVYDKAFKEDYSTNKGIDEE